MDWDDNYIEWCNIMKQTPNRRDQIIFMAGETFSSINQLSNKSKIELFLWKMARLEKTVEN